MAGWAEIAFSVVFAYLIGSLSPGYAVGWLKGVDVREVGGRRNTGATSVYAIAGMKLSVAVAILDILKGIIAFAIAVSLGLSALVAYVSAIMVIVGHRWPLYLGFRGGKGVASGGGAFGASAIYYHDLLSYALMVLFMVYAFSVSHKWRCFFVKRLKKS